MNPVGERGFLSIYFPSRDEDGQRVTRNVCVAFNLSSEKALYREVCRRTTTELKQVLAIYSYDQLVKTAEKENRRISEFIKLRLSERIGKDRTPGVAGRYIRTEPARIRKWKSWVETAMSEHGDMRMRDLVEFLDELARAEPEDGALHHAIKRPAKTIRAVRRSDSRREGNAVHA